jgi:alkanesulfonate monooxygenase SsuD/methylene tetrahydromethanopterin reductase-like flavin-dependent oxidoreductase (luciferase family)
MPEKLPAISLVAVPGRRRQTLELAREMERRGFGGIYMPSRYGSIDQCTALALSTERIRFGTAVSPIYMRNVEDFAQSAAYIHEVSGGRFHFGIGIAHAPAHARLGVSVGKPLADTRAFVEKYKSYRDFGPVAPIMLAALRRRMTALAGEIAEGVVYANAALSHMARSLAALPPGRRDDGGFLVGNMLPVCITEDIAAAKELHRRRLVRYALLPNYRNYWKEAGYTDEMAAIEKALAESRHDDIPRYFTDRWLDDVTLYGPAARIRDGVARWQAAGVDTPVLVPNSINGNQLVALQEIFATFE